MNQALEPDFWFIFSSTDINNIASGMAVFHTSVLKKTH